MSSSDQGPQEESAGKREEESKDLDRIASAIEKLTEETRKKGETGKQEAEGGGAKQEEKPQGKAKRFLRSPKGILILAVIAVVALIAGMAIWHYESTHESTDDAYTAGHVHEISPRVAGLAQEVWVDDNQNVKEGDLLVKLDPRDYEVALQRAEANLDQAKAQVLQAESAIAQARANYDQAEAQVAQAAARYEVATIDYNRNKSLYTRDVRAVAQADVDTTKSTLDANHAGLDATKASAEAAKSMIATREAELIVAKAAVETNQAEVANAKLQLSYCWVLSPCAGRVSRKTVETGQQLSAGQALMAVTENEVWVLANLKETQLAKVRVGQPVKIKIDAFNGHAFTGRVDSIQDGSGATYSLLPPDNATGNFTKIVQRVPVKVTFDRESVKGFQDLIVPGLSVAPVIELSGTLDRQPQLAKPGTEFTAFRQD